MISKLLKKNVLVNNKDADKFKDFDNSKVKKKLEERGFGIY